MYQNKNCNMYTISIISRKRQGYNNPQKNLLRAGAATSKDQYLELVPSREDRLTRWLVGNFEFGRLGSPSVFSPLDDFRHCF